MTTRLDDYLVDAARAINAGHHYAGLALTLALPDICGAIEYPGIRSSQRYTRWYRSWCRRTFLFVGPKDVYALRCAFLHEGRDEFSNQQRAKPLLERLMLTGPAQHGMWQTNFDTPSEKPRSQVPVVSLCRGILEGAGRWQRARLSDERVMREIEGLLTIWPPGTPLN